MLKISRSAKNPRSSVFSRSARCPVKAKIKPDGEIIALVGSHNHPPENNGFNLEFRETRKKWLMQIQREPAMKPSDAILEERRDLLPEAACEIRTVEHVRTAQRWAAKMKPDPVESLQEACNVISTQLIPRYTMTKDGQSLMPFYLEGFNSLFLTTTRLLDLIPSAVMVHADATYKIITKTEAHQLFTIHGHWEGPKGAYVSECEENQCGLHVI